MLIPDFWAEGRAQRRQGQRQVTVRRWGWSSTHPAEAQAMADARAQQALEALWQGAKGQLRREPKMPYQGADGVPIREEVLRRVGEQVITRNSYGAHCLNSPQLFIADIDRSEMPPVSVRPAWGVFGSVVAAFAAGLGLPGLLWGLLPALALACGAHVLVGRWQARRHASLPDPAPQRIQDFAARHADWRLRVYETPRGWRVLATHQALDPRSDAVHSAFTALGVDPVYARMCRQQACFRARLTGKPWRMPLPHFPGRSVVWPPSSAQAARRTPWVLQYDAVARQYAACRFVHELGAGQPDASLAATVALHDDESRALSPLPLA